MHRSCGIFLVAGLSACLAACGSTASGTEQPVPDYLDANLEVVMRSFARPCAADIDRDGDGKVDNHYIYTYDSLGRSQRDLGRDRTGAIYEQVDYTWDNAGHLVKQRDAYPRSLTVERTNVYDTLGRQTEYHAEIFDSDPGDNTSTLNSSDTISYSHFDELGHSAHGDETYDDHNQATTQTLTREYGYDELGRRTSIDIHFMSGELYEEWRIAYDDTAHTVTWNINEARGLRDGSTGYTMNEVDTYDADGRWLATHYTTVEPPGGDSTATYDAAVRWDGDRELGITDAYVSAGSVTKTSTTYQYDCPSARGGH